MLKKLFLTIFFMVLSSFISAQVTTQSMTGQTSFDLPWAGSDSVSGLKSVKLFYRRGETGDFVQYGTEFTTSPITFDTTLTGGDGLYYFYTIGIDNVGNVESSPASPDVSVLVDSTPPSTPTLSAEPAFTKGTTNTIEINATVGDDLFIMEWSSNPNFSPVLGTTDWTTETLILIEGLSNGQIYYYRAKAKSSVNIESGWSSVVFSTQDDSPPYTSIQNLPIIIAESVIRIVNLLTG